MKSKPGVRTAERMLFSDGKEMVMRYLEFDPRMFADHTTAVYHSSVNALLTTTTKDRTDHTEGLCSRTSVSVEDATQPSKVPESQLLRFIEDGDSVTLSATSDLGASLIPPA